MRFEQLSATLSRTGEPRWLQVHQSTPLATDWAVHPQPSDPTCRPFAAITGSPRLTHDLQVLPTSCVCVVGAGVSSQGNG